MCLGEKCKVVLIILFSNVFVSLCHPSPCPLSPFQELKDGVFTGILFFFKYLFSFAPFRFDSKKAA